MKAVIFDFNGTLYNDSHLHVAAWASFIRKHFPDVRMTNEEIHKKFIGPSNANIFGMLFGRSMSHEEVHHYSEMKEEEYRATVRSDEKNLHLVNGVPEMLDSLTEKGIPFALATSSVIGNVQMYLEDLGLKKWFDMDRIVYEDGRLASKPDPAFYLEAARRLGVRPEECIIAEDSPTGIQAAINAHAGKIIAIDTTASREWLENNPEIHAVIHDFCDFERFI